MSVVVVAILGTLSKNKTIIEKQQTNLKKKEKKKQKKQHNKAKQGKVEVLKC